MIAAVALGCVCVSAVAELDVSGSGGGRRAQIYEQGPYTSDDLVLSGGSTVGYTMRFGRLKVRPRLEVSLIYDDNIYLDKDSSVSDAYGVLIPGILVLYGDEAHNHVYVDYAREIPAFFTEKQENVESQRLTGFLHYELDRTALTAWHRYRDTRGADTLLGARITKEEYITSVGLDRQVSTKTAFTLTGMHEFHDYESRRYVDYYQYELAGRFYWSAFPKTDLFGQLARGWVDLVARDFGDARYTEASLGVRGRLRPKVKAVGSVGAQYRDFEDEAISDLLHWVANLKVDGTLFRHTKGGLGLWTSLRPAIDRAGYTSIDTRLEPFLSRRILSERVIGSVSGVLGISEYRGTDDPLDPGAGDDTMCPDQRRLYQGFTVIVDWWWARHCVLGVGYSYIESGTWGKVEPVLEEGSKCSVPSYTGDRWLIRAGVNF